MLRTRISGGIIITALIFLFSSFDAPAQAKPQWPNFHGPDRTNRSTETGLLQSWPEAGPKLSLTIGGLGEGFSSVSIADGLLFTAGLVDDQPYVFAFDLTGKPVWKKPAGKKWTTTASWAASYIGPRSTPTYDKGVVYFLGELGLLLAFDARTGRELWQVDLPAVYDAPLTEYGYSESVMIDGNNLYVRPVGVKGHQVCLDKRTGKQIWANTEIPGKEGYTSPVLYEAGGYRQVVGASSNCYYGVDTKTGKLLWKADVVNQVEVNAADAIIHNNHLFVSSGLGLGCMLFRLEVSSAGIKPVKVWESNLMDNYHGGVLFHNGYVYGSGNRSRGWYCIDFMTGEQKWRATTDEGCLTYADGMLYLLDQRGTMKLVRATPEKYEVKGEFKLPSGGTGSYWAHPVVCDRKLYVRHADKIFVYDIGR